MVPALPAGLVGSVKDEEGEDAVAEEGEEAEEEDAEIGVAAGEWVVSFRAP